MGNSTRFLSAIQTSRPRSSRVIEAFSPKLGRRLHCYGNHAFDQWICLEADPDVLTFCERPVFLDSGTSKRLADYWVQRLDREMLLLIGDQIGPSSFVVNETEIQVQAIPSIELSAARMWIDNWERMLTTLTSCRNLISPALIDSVLRLVSEPMQMSRIEQQFGASDPTLVRGALFSLLHTGQVQAPQLKTAPLSFLTCFQRAERLS